MKAPSVDLFISYANEDEPWVDGYLLDALAGAGLRLHSEQAFSLGVPRLVEFERAIRESARTLLVLSPAYMADSASQIVDLLGQSYGMETATWPVIPLVLEPVELPTRLAMLTSLDATDPAEWENTIARLLRTFERPVPETPPLPDCPYPGMVPFSENDSRHFFGRDHEVQEMLERLRLHPFLTVIGPSGSGKSSLVYAGLLPALRQTRIFGRGQWQIEMMRPGETPAGALQAILNAHPRYSETQRVDGQLLLFVDQFEETFTSAGQQAPEFQESLLALARKPNIYIVLTVRADFFTDLMSSPLWKEIQSHRIEIAPLDAAGLRDAIVRPAEQCGVFIESALVERMLIDAAGEPGALPLIQETLVLLWEKIERRFLPLRAYASLILPRQKYGEAPRTGLQIAIARRADAAYADLSGAGQAIARRVFLRLVQFGEGRADTRRQQPISALESEGEEANLFRQTIDHLTDHRLLTVSGEERESDDRRELVVVDIAHEALIEGWPQLKRWIATRRESEQTRRRLEQKAAEWLRLGRGEGGLLDEFELLEAENWLGGPDAEELGYSEELIGLKDASRRARDAAEKAKEHSRQRELAQAKQLVATQRQRSVVLTAGLVIAVLLSVLSLSLYRSAETRRAQAEAAQVMAEAAQSMAEAAQFEAEEQTTLAQAGQLSALARLNLRNRYDLALLLSLEVDPDLVNTMDLGGNLIEGLEYDSQIEFFLHGHSAPVTSVAFSADGSMLASGSMNGEIFLWDLATATIAHEIYTELGAIQQMRFLPDDETLLAIGMSQTSDRAGLWDVRTFQPKEPLSLERFGDYWNVTVSPDGSMLAFAADRTTYVFWDVLADRQIGEDIVLVAEPTEYDWTSGMAISPDNRLLGMYLGNREHKGVVILDIAERVRIGAPLEGHANEAGWLSFGPASNLLVSGSSDGSTILWDTVNLQLVDRLPNSASWPIEFRRASLGRGLAFSPDGELLAMGQEEGKIVLWDLFRNRALDQPLTGREGDVISLAFSPDSRFLAAGGMDQSIVLWRLDAAHRLGKPIAGTDYYSSHAQFSPDGRSLAWVKFNVVGPGDFHYSFTLWDLESGAITKERSMEDQQSSLTFDSNGSRLFGSSYYGTLYTWDLGSDDMITQTLDTSTGATLVGTSLVDFTSDGRLVAFADVDFGDFVNVFDVVRNTPVTSLRLEGVTSLAFSPDERVLAIGDLSGTLVLRDAETWRQTGSLTQPDGAVSAFAFSPDTSRLASAGPGNTIYLWDSASQSLVAELKNPKSRSVRTLAFSGDGSTLAAGNQDGIISLWDLNENRLLGEFATGYRNGVSDLDFSPDGNYLVSSGGDYDTPVILWEVTPAAWRRAACQVANRNLTQEEWQQFFPGKPYHQTCPDS